MSGEDASRDGHRHRGVRKGPERRIPPHGVPRQPPLGREEDGTDREALRVTQEAGPSHLRRMGIRPAGP